MPAIQEVFQPLELHLGSSRTRTEQLEIHLNTAADSLSSNDLDLAKEALAEARRWNPASTRIWLLWRDVYQAEDDLDGQQYALETAIGLSTNLGNILKWLKELEELTGQKYTYCEICRQLGTMDGFYQVQKGYVSCPLCIGKARRRNSKEWGWIFGGAILALILAGPVSMLGSGWPFTILATNSLLLLLLYLGLVPLHEFAHALVALALKGYVQFIQLGVGPKLKKINYRSFEIRLHRYFIGGLTQFGFPTRRLIRLRQFLTTMAGPLLHLVLIAIFLPGAQWGELVSGVAWREAIIIANGILLLINANPMNKLNTVMGVPVDGAQLVQILRGHLSADLIHQGYYHLRSGAAGQAGDPITAITILDQGLIQYPQCFPMKINRAIYLGSLGRYDEAHASLCETLENLNVQMEGGEAPEVQIPLELNLAMLRNAIAYYESMPFSAEYNPMHATELAFGAFKRAPWMPGISGTLGSCLVELGFPAAGLMYLEMANRAQISQGAIPSPDNLAWSALAMKRMGRHLKAKQTLANIREKDVEENLHAWIEGEVLDISG